jgi:hypothetical protein
MFSVVNRQKKHGLFWMMLLVTAAIVVSLAPQEKTLGQGIRVLARTANASCSKRVRRGAGGRSARQLGAVVARPGAVELRARHSAWMVYLCSATGVASSQCRQDFFVCPHPVDLSIANTVMWRGRSLDCLAFEAAHGNCVELREADRIVLVYWEPAATTMCFTRVASSTTPST